MALLRIRQSIKKELIILGAVVALGFVLRFWGLSSSSPSLYWEEAALGYDAFSLLKTGRDHHGNKWPVVALESFGDWKPTGYVYAALPFISVFGLSETAIRLPSVVAGTLLIIVTYVLSSLIVQRISLSLKHVPLITALLVAISPWTVHFSRAAWESNLAFLFFLVSLTATFLWMKNLPTRQFRALSWLLFAVSMAVCAMYTYHAQRIIAPLASMVTYGFLILTNRDKVVAIHRRWRIVFVLSPLLLAVLLLLPLLQVVTSPVGLTRFDQTSIFTDLSIIQRSNAFRSEFDKALWARVVSHRYVLFSSEIIKNLFSHLTLSFLFISGDQNPRHSVPGFGVLYVVTLPFLFIGLIRFGLVDKKATLYLILLLGLIFLPSAVSYGSPHALRTLPASFVLLLLIAVGLTYVKSYRFIMFLLLISTVHFSWTVVSQYPVASQEAWQAGYKELYSELSRFEQVNPGAEIQISREEGRPAMYLWFFNQSDPEVVQSFRQQAEMDQGEFLTFLQYSFFSFCPSNSTSIVALGTQSRDRCGYTQRTPLSEIKINGEPRWYIYSQP